MRSDKQGLAQNDAPATGARPRAFMSASDMAANFSGGPILVVSAKLLNGQQDAFADWPFPVLFAQIDADGDTHLTRDKDGANRGQEIEIHQPPRDVLAIVAPEADADHLSRLWDADPAGHVPSPPVVVAGSFEHVARQLLARLDAETARAEARCAELQRALATTRAEYEETRVAMHGLMRTLSHQQPANPHLAATAMPSAGGETIALSDSAPCCQTIPVVAEGVTGIALHVCAPLPARNAGLQVLLIGAESDRVLGEWRVPGEALHTGWNVLDLPIPVGPIRETAEVQVCSAAAPDAPLLLSLSDERIRDDADRPNEQLLAVKIWAAAQGGRFTQADHWIWNSVGRTTLPKGTALSVPAFRIERAMTRGRLHIERDADRKAVIMGSICGGDSLLLIPDVSMRGIGAIRVELAMGIGDLRGTRFELFIRSGKQSFSNGWRAFHFLEKTISFGLSLPAAITNIVDIGLRIEDVERKGAEFATFEVRRLDLMAVERAVTDSGLEQKVVNLDGWPHEAQTQERLRFGGVKLISHNAAESYELFDVSLTDLAFDGRVVPVVKFKYSLTDKFLNIEFRHGAGRAEIFKQWPGTQQDRHGKYFRISQTTDDVHIGGTIADDADRQLLLALLRLLPTIVATGVQLEPVETDRLRVWMAAARRLSRTAQRAIEGTAFA